VVIFHAAVIVSGIMMVVGASLPELALKNGGWNARRMIEHQPTSVEAGSDKNSGPGECEDHRCATLAGSHAALPHDSPERQ
jgi:hypothetical protein